MLIVAYLMGLENHCIKEILTEKRTLEIIEEYDRNYDLFCSKIAIEPLNGRYQLIKLPHKEETIKAKENVPN